MIKTSRITEQYPEKIFAGDSDPFCMDEQALRDYDQYTQGIYAQLEAGLIISRYEYQHSRGDSRLELDAENLLEGAINLYKVPNSDQQNTMANIYQCGIQFSAADYPDQISREIQLQILETAQHSRNLMISSNLRLVRKLARKYSQTTYGEFLDLFDIGVAELGQAIGRFDTSRGYQFSTYATYWINRGMARYCRNGGRGIVLPDHVHNRLGNIRKTIALLAEANNGEPPKLEEISQYCGIDAHGVQEALQWERISLTKSLEETGFGSNEVKFDHLRSARASSHKLPADPDAQDPEKKAIDADINQIVWRAINKLESDEQKIVIMLYGFDGNHPRSKTAVAKDLQICTNTLNRKLNKIFCRIRSILEEMEPFDLLSA